MIPTLPSARPLALSSSAEKDAAHVAVGAPWLADGKATRSPGDVALHLKD